MLDAGLKPRLFAYMGGIFRELGGTALLINGPTDHVHILVLLPAKLGLSEVVGRVKANSSGWVHRELPDTAVICASESASAEVILKTLRAGALEFLSQPLMLEEVTADRHVLLDLGSVDFMDSSGLKVLITQTIRRGEAGGSLYVRNPSRAVRRRMSRCRGPDRWWPRRRRRSRSAHPRSPCRPHVLQPQESGASRWWRT